MDILSVQQQQADAATVKKTTEQRAHITVRSPGEGVPPAAETGSVDSTTHISAGEHPLTLVEKLSLEELQELFKPYLGEDVLEQGLAQDNSPEGTAGRIVDIATAFFETYKLRHPDESASNALEKYVEFIRQAIDKGFNDAKDILAGLNVLDGGIADTIDKTYELVQRGLDQFLEENRPEQVNEGV